MDTALARYFRLFTAPVALVLGALIVIIALTSVDPQNPYMAMLVPVLRWPTYIATAFLLGGSCWLVYRFWILYRWETGEFDGECHNCAGPVSHKDGRYGPYSVCFMCGAKRRG